MPQTIDKFTLLSGNTIISKELGLIFHQPTLNEIGMMGEREFFSAVGALNFSKEQLDREQIDDELYEELTDFGLTISILNSEDRIIRTKVELLFSILFKDYSFEVMQNCIKFIYKTKTESGKDIQLLVAEENFETFRDYINLLTIIQNAESNEPKFASERAKAIAEKLKSSADRRKKAKGGDEEKNNGYVLLNTVSSLAIGIKLPIYEIFNFTLVQFYDQLKRFQTKEEYDGLVQAMLNGAQDIELESWYRNL